jgi:hypothetical protein
MSLTLALLREDLRDHLGKNSSTLDNTAADRLLNRTWWALAAQLRFNERDAEHTFTTVDGTDTYALPTDSEAIQRVVIQDTDSSGWEPLTRIDDWSMFPLKDDTDESLPTHYSRRGDDFILWPCPGDEYDVRVKYLRTLADIEASGPDAPQEWHEVILWGAVARGFFADGDYDRGTKAQAQQALYIQSLDTEEVRETEDRVYSGIRVLKRKYP